MKHLLSTVLLCGVGILGSQAQNVVITDKDGLTHRFHADYVQEITFEKIGAQNGYDFQFDNLIVNPWSKTNVGVTFYSGENTVSLDLYQPSSFYLMPGLYKVDPSYGDYTVDPGYSTIVVDGNSDTLKSGEMNVTQSGDDYNFEMKFMLASGKELKGSYTGPLNAYGITINYDLSGCTYANMNEPASNGFYYNFNDENYKLEMRIEIFSEGNAPAAGVYSFSDTMENGTASSYVNLYSPYNETTKFTEGTVTVSEEDGDTLVEIEGKLGIGLTMKASYRGKLPARPANEVETSIEFKSIEVNSYGTRNETIALFNEEQRVVFDFYQPTAYYFQPGTYTIDGSNADYTIDPAYSSVNLDGTEKDILSGSVIVALNGDTYTFTCDIKYDGGDLKCSYVGTLPNFGPVIDYNLTGCAYANMTEPASNGFYYNFNDENYKVELRIELFSEGNAPAAGVYSFSDTMENGTASSYINLYSPYNETTKFTEGTVTVSEEGGDTLVEIEGKLGIGLTMKASYRGKLPARPAAE